MPDHPDFLLRQATPADAALMAHHRAEMFRDMGRVANDTAYDALVASSIAFFERHMALGDYAAWLAAPRETPGTIVAGAGVQLLAALPVPDARGERVSCGQRGLIVNVFTERAWRRRGAAMLAVESIIAWARGRGIRQLVLHASAEGRPLYEKVGFVASNEMRYTGSL